MFARTLKASLLALLFPAMAQAATVYSQDFETAPLGAEWSGAGAVMSSAGLSAYGFGNLHLKNDGASASVLALSGLAAHTNLTLTFDLAIWDSVDYGGDMLVVKVDGVDLINETFGNYYPTTGSAGPGTQLTPATNGAHTDPQLGYEWWRDSARHVSVTMAHTGPNAVISFQFPNTQGAPDESFGIDNVVVSTTPVPEPSAVLMGLAGLGVAAMAGRRARRA